MKTSCTVHIDRLVLVGALLTAPGLALAGRGVTAEATDEYCDASGHNCSSIICIAEADNFRNGLLNAPGTIFTPGNRYTNKLV